MGKSAIKLSIKLLYVDEVKDILALIQKWKEANPQMDFEIELTVDS